MTTETINGVMVRRFRQTDFLPENRMNNDEAAELLGLSKSTLNAWRSSDPNRLPYFKIAHRVFYPKRYVLEYAASQVAGGDAPKALINQA